MWSKRQKVDHPIWDSCHHLARRKHKRKPSHGHRVIFFFITTCRWPFSQQGWHLGAVGSGQPCAHLAAPGRKRWAPQQETCFTNARLYQQEFFKFCKGSFALQIGIGMIVKFVRITMSSNEQYQNQTDYECMVMVSTFVDWITCLCPRRLAGPNGEETGQDSTCWMLKTVPVLHIRRLRTTDLRGVYDVETFPKHIDKPSALTFYLQHGDFNPCQSALQYDIISQKKIVLNLLSSTRNVNAKTIKNSFHPRPASKNMWSEVTRKQYWHWT